MTTAEAMPKAKAAAERAVQLDDNSADAHESLGAFKSNLEYDWAGAELEFRRAIELTPNFAPAHDQLGSMLAEQGRLEEALAEGQRVEELDPLNFWVVSDIVTTLAWQGKYGAAKHIAHSIDGIDRTNFVANNCGGWTDLQAGKIRDAIPELQKAAPMLLWSAGMLGYAYGARQATAPTRWRSLRS